MRKPRDDVYEHVERCAFPGFVVKMYRQCCNILIANV